MLKFSECLKKAREKAGLSQKQLAEKLNVPPPVISRYESTNIEPRLGFVLKIIETLNLTPNTFFNYNFIETIRHPVNEELIELRKKANLSVEEVAVNLKIPVEKYTAFETGIQLPSLSTLNKLFLFYKQEPLDETAALFFSPLLYSALISINSEISPLAQMDLNEDTGKIYFSYPNIGIRYEIEPSNLQKVCDIAEEKVIKMQSNVHKELFRYEIAKAIIKLNSITSERV